MSKKITKEELDFIESWNNLSEDKEFQNRLNEIRLTEEKDILEHAKRKSDSFGNRKPFEGESFKEYSEYVKSIT